MQNAVALFYYDNFKNLNRSFEESQNILRNAEGRLFVAVIGNDGMIKRNIVPETNGYTLDAWITAYMAEHF